MEKSAEKSAEKPLRVCKHKGFTFLGRFFMAVPNLFVFNSIELNPLLVNRLSLWMGRRDPQVPHFVALGALAVMFRLW